MAVPQLTGGAAGREMTVVAHALRSLILTNLLFVAPLASITGQDSVTTSSYLVYLRAGGASPTYGYVLYNVGKGVFGIGVVADWQNKYREFVAGAGLNLYAANGNGATVMAAGANASDSWYLELWVFPAIAAGHLSLTGFGGLYVPAERAGVWQYYFDPATLLWRAGKSIAIGSSYSGYKVEGLAARHGLGPALQIFLPHGSAMVEVLRPLQNFSHELRVTMQFTF